MTSVGGHETVVPKQEQMTIPLIDDDERHIRQATLLMTLNCSTRHTIPMISSNDLRSQQTTSRIPLTDWSDISNANRVACVSTISSDQQIVHDDLVCNADGPFSCGISPQHADPDHTDGDPRADRGRSRNIATLLTASQPLDGSLS